MIYSFYYDADYSLIQILKEEYDVDTPNTVLVNGNITPPITHIDDIRAVLDNNSAQEDDESDDTIRLNWYEKYTSKHIFL